MNTEIIKVCREEILNNEKLKNSISTLIQETFLDIKDKYSEESPFKQEVENILDTINNLDDSNFFYLIQNNKKELIACLRALEKEGFLNPEMGDGNIFYSKYIGIDKKHRRLGLGKKLKKELEKNATKKTQINNKTSLIASRVHKQNTNSQKRNKSIGYKQRDEGENSDYMQFYKESFPKEETP